jgi:hypothetical protein
LNQAPARAAAEAYLMEAAAFTIDTDGPAL